MKYTSIYITAIATATACYFADRFIVKPKEYALPVIAEDIMLEFSKAGLPYPAINVKNNSSIHIITDENDRLIDVQVIDTKDSNKVSQYCTYSLIKKM